MYLAPCRLGSGYYLRPFTSATNYRHQAHYPLSNNFFRFLPCSVFDKMISLTRVDNCFDVPDTILRFTASSMYVALSLHPYLQRPCSGKLRPRPQAECGPLCQLPIDNVSRIVMSHIISTADRQIPPARRRPHRRCLAVLSPPLRSTISFLVPICRC